MRDNVLGLGLISSFVPKKCGIATFSRDLMDGLQQNNPKIEFKIAAAENPDENYSYDDEVISILKSNSKASYVLAAQKFNNLKLDGILLQHEYGLYGGNWTAFEKAGIQHNDPVGDYLFELLGTLKLPLIATLHTVLPNPDQARKNVIRKLSDRASVLVTMTQDSKRLLVTEFGIANIKVVVIPHGVPNPPLISRASVLKRLNLNPEHLYLVITGLISPNKGIDLVIRALPKILDRHPNVRLLVVGETHPQIVVRDGEKYRESLIKLADQLSVRQAVIFINEYVETSTLMEFLSASDVYLTIHRDPEQAASGTLAYAVGCGLPIVSTPYRYAQELLANGRGFMVPFEDSQSIAKTINEMLKDKDLRLHTKRKLKAYSQSMQWSTVGKTYLRLIDQFFKSDK